LTPQLIKRVHELYEELGREEVRAVLAWEKAEGEIPKDETKAEAKPEAEAIGPKPEAKAATPKPDAKTAEPKPEAKAAEPKPEAKAAETSLTLMLRPTSRLTASPAKRPPQVGPDRS